MSLAHHAVSLVALAPPAARAFAGLTFPRYRDRLEEAAAGCVAVGAVAAGQPVGLALADLPDAPPADGEAALLSIYVDPARRRRGIGRALLDAVEDRLRGRGAARVEAVYAVRGAQPPPIAALLDAAGWSAPERRMLLVTVDGGALAARTLRTRPLPAPLEIQPWSLVSDAEREALRRAHAAQPWYPEEVSPFREPAIQEPINSLALRREGRLAGWLVTHRIAPATIRYTSLFVHPSCRGRGASLALMGEAGRRQAEALGPASHATLGVWAGNRRMWRYVERELAPACVDRFETAGRTKRLR